MTETALPLFEPREHHRAADPETSREAAEQAGGLAHRHQAIVLACLRDAGRPLAAEQIADRAGLDSHVTVNRRLPELVRAGLIRRTDERHRNRSKRGAYRYEAI